MEAKDTMEDQDGIEALIQSIFEAGKQEGRREVVEWVDKNWLERQDKLKEWGIKDGNT